MSPQPLPVKPAQNQSRQARKQKRQAHRVTDAVMESVGSSGDQSGDKIQVRRIGGKQIQGDDLPAGQALDLRCDLIDDQTCEGMTDRGWHPARPVLKLSAGSAGM